ncbi:MAG: amidohydrolase, partial [Gammaproteobacteria bacterium]|nr:amidohydrolase [Gammaproteobacteria bacterium]
MDRFAACVRLGAALWLCSALSAAATPPREAPAELVLQGGRIYTADATQRIAQALAVRDGRLVFIGSDVDARRFVGLATRVESLGGRLVLPGLVDAHIHPL